MNIKLTDFESWQLGLPVGQEVEIEGHIFCECGRSVWFINERNKICSKCNKQYTYDIVEVLKGKLNIKVINGNDKDTIDTRILWDTNERPKKTKEHFDKLIPKHNR